MDASHPLRQYRKREGISLQDLAERVGSTKSWLSRIEDGAQASPSLIRKLIAATDLAADDFLQSEPTE